MITHVELDVTKNNLLEHVQLVHVDVLRCRLLLCKYKGEIMKRRVQLLDTQHCSSEFRTSAILLQKVTVLPGFSLAIRLNSVFRAANDLEEIISSWPDCGKLSDEAELKLFLMTIEGGCRSIERSIVAADWAGVAENNWAGAERGASRSVARSS